MWALALATMMSGSEPRPVALYSPSRRRTVTSPCASVPPVMALMLVLQIRGAAYNLGNDALKVASMGPAPNPARRISSSPAWMTTAAVAGMRNLSSSARTRCPSGSDCRDRQAVDFGEDQRFEVFVMHVGLLVREILDGGEHHR